MKTLVIIPARGGSKSIPKKNIKPLGGRPLIHWTVEAASQAQLVSDVVVATDDAEIAGTVEAAALPKVRVVGRSAATATDTASTESVLLEVIGNEPCDLAVLVQATSPFLTGEDLDAALARFHEGGFDTLLSVVRQKRFIWDEAGDGLVRPANYDPLARPRRQEFSGYLVENGAFYIFRPQGLLESGSRLHGRIGCHEMAEESYFEIDEPSDWEIIERLLARRG